MQTVINKKLIIILLLILIITFADFDDGIILTAAFKLSCAGNDELFCGSDLSLGLGVAVTVIPRVARILATALASDFFGLCGLGCGFRTDKVMESERCMTLPSEGSDVPPCKKLAIFSQIFR